MQEVCILFTVYFILFFFIIGLKNYFNILSSTHFSQLLFSNVLITG